VPYLGGIVGRGLLIRRFWVRVPGGVRDEGPSRRGSGLLRDLVFPGIDPCSSPRPWSEPAAYEFVAREHTPPEVEQLSLFLATAVEVVPDIAPLLTLGAVTGMRRGELVTVRRSRVRHEQGQLVVDAASDGKRVKPTKTRKERTVAVDAATVQMLQRHCAQMDERAALCGLEIGPDAFVFSLALDCSTPMPPDHVTKRVALPRNISASPTSAQRPSHSKTKPCACSAQGQAHTGTRNRRATPPCAECPTQPSVANSGAATVGPRWP
jgi:hypothetical protein